METEKNNEKWSAFADRLETIKNNRQNRTLELVIKDLKAGRIEDAKTECFNNGDKLTTWFPEAVKLLADELFAEDERNPFRFTLPSEDSDDEEDEIT